MDRSTAHGPPKSLMSDHVILLHGLWMRGFALALLRRRLHEQTFVVHRFEYLSVAATQLRILERLRQRMVSLGPAPVHLVGHSLGGLLALRACADAEGLPPGRIVCLGSPLKGSAAARGFAHWGGEMLLGHNRELLERGFDQWSGARQVGMLAGRMPIGLGAVLGQLEGDHDGTVAVEETRQPWLSDHCVIETSHTGLLLSADVAQRVGQFLRQGSFAVGVN
jgi:pimeloyl-ACP methyl ester carboxylesterase